MATKKSSNKPSKNPWERGYTGFDVLPIPKKPKKKSK